MDRLLKILGLISTVATPQVFSAAQKAAINLRKDARLTPNPWDDILADILCDILGVPSDTDTRDKTDTAGQG